MTKRIALAIACVAAGAVAAPPKPLPHPIPHSYEFIPLSAGEESRAKAINNAGRVVGTTGAPGQETGFVWDVDSGLQALSASDKELRPADINDAGAIVGTAVTGCLGCPTYELQGFVLYDGTLTLLPGLAAGDVSVPRAINGWFQIAGASFNPLSGGYTPVAWWFDSPAFDLGTGSAMKAFAFDVNNLMQVVGQTGGMGWLWWGAAAAIPVHPRAINDASVVVGVDIIDKHAVSYSGGTVTQLQPATGGADSRANAVSNSGIIVGAESVSGVGNNAIVWAPGATQAVDLNTFLPPHSGWRLEEATGVNDAGWIVGVGCPPGCRPEGSPHEHLQGFVLRPHGPGRMLP